MSDPTPVARQENSTNVRSFLRFGMGLTGRLAPELAARIAARMFVTPRRHQRPPREREVLAWGQRIEEAGGLVGWTWGEGPPVLLMHGWEGRAAQLGAFVGPLVAAGLKVVGYDAPAHGESAGKTATLIECAA
jgi:hypothetical protein